MEGKSLKDVYNRLIDLYGFYEINKDSDEYKIALRFMSQEDLLKDDIDNIRLLVKDDGEDYMYFIINENTDYIGGGACGEEMITKYETINQDIILYYGFSEEDKIKQTNRYKIYISLWQDYCGADFSFYRVYRRIGEPSLFRREF